MAIIKFLHLLSMSIWVGSIVFFSFFAAPIIFKKLPREVAGDVVGGIFPKYWAIGYAGGAVSLLTLAIMMISEKDRLYARLVLLVLMLCVSLYSGLAVGKRAASLKAEMRASGNAEEKDALRARFRKVHAISSILNMTVLALGSAFIFLTSMEL
ncbi:MAG: DUF4149 domain-containing protein [Thermodesulfobacteriota bacterium]